MGAGFGDQHMVLHGGCDIRWGRSNQGLGSALASPLHLLATILCSCVSHPSPPPTSGSPPLAPSLPLLSVPHPSPPGRYVPPSNLPRDSAPAPARVRDTSDNQLRRPHSTQPNLLHNITPRHQGLDSSTSLRTALACRETSANTLHEVHPRSTERR